MTDFKDGVKDEAWSDTLEQSHEAEDAVMQYLSGFDILSARLPRRLPVTEFPDDGDLITYRYNERNQKYLFETVDVKRNSNWKVEKFQHEIMLLTTVEQPLHNDWIYMSCNADLTRVAIFDMKLIYPNVAAVEMETTNRRGEPQMSVGLPFKIAKVRKLT